MLQRKSADTRKTEIIEALLGLADRIGPDRLTTNDIARAVGVTQAAIFRHFPTKAELWSEAGEVIAQRMAEAWSHALASETTARGRLRALIAVQLRQIAVCPALPAILHSRELNVDNADLRARFRGVLMAYQGHLVAALAEMIAEGSMSARVRPLDAAVLLTSLVQGIAIRWSLGSRGFVLEEEGMRLLDVQLTLFECREDPR
jgi:AcrR family transcriptional regulator